MSGTITLPREVVEKAIKAFENGCPPTCENGMIDSGGFLPWGEPMLDLCPACLAFEHLRTHLAAEQPKPEPVATVGTQSAAWKGYDGRWSPPGDPIKVVHLLRDLPLGTLLYAAPPDIEALRRDAERYKWVLNWLVKNGLLTWERCRIDTPESFGDWWILRKPKVIDGSSLLGYGKTENAAIDAAMEGKR